ncbi:MAG: hypothetical protein V3T72_13030 [Thermoanaerobaculia bacterium]
MAEIRGAAPRIAGHRSVYLNAACAPRQLLKKHFAAVADRLHPRLLHRGFDDLPLSVLADLSCLFVEGANVDYQVPSAPPVAAELLQAYCHRLRQATAHNQPLRRLVDHARRSMAGAWSWSNATAVGALLTFLERAGGFFPSSAGLAGRPESDQVAVRRLLGFLTALAKRPAMAPPSEIDELLFVADVRRRAASEGFDLPLLDACLGYSLLELEPDQERRYRQLLRTISPRLNHSARSPECGNHGITNRGNLSAVLRSFLARDDFAERLEMGQVLYFERFAGRLEPRRVLLVWIIERSPEMQRRVAGLSLRRETAALRLAAATLEDTVRYLRDQEALDLRIAVLLHDGGRSASGVRGLYLEPPPEVLALAPDTDSGQPAWLPRVNGFWPDFFLREAVWPHEGEGPGRRAHRHLDGRVTVGSESPAYLRALGALPGRSPGSAGETPGEDSAFDLRHAFVFGPESDLPAAVDHGGRVLRGWNSINYVAFGEQEIRWSARPRLRYAPRSVAAPYDPRAVEDAPRRACWNDLCGRLLAM